MSRDEVQDAADDPCRQHADDGVGKEVEGDGHGRGALDAQPELDGKELPPAEEGAEAEEVG